MTKIYPSALKLLVTNKSKRNDSPHYKPNKVLFNNL